MQVTCSNQKLDTNIYNVYSDMNIQASLCACKHYNHHMANANKVIKSFRLVSTGTK